MLFDVVDPTPLSVYGSSLQPDELPILVSLSFAWVFSSPFFIFANSGSMVLMLVVLFDRLYVFSSPVFAFSTELRMDCIKSTPLVSMR